MRAPRMLWFIAASVGRVVADRCARRRHARPPPPRPPAAQVAPAASPIAAGAPDGDEGEVDPAPAGQPRGSPRPRPGPATTPSVAPKRARRLELAAAQVDRDDPPGAGDRRALDGVQPDAAGADHRHAGARRARRAVFTTAPTPVMTPQASRQARSGGRSSGSRTHWLASTTTASAKARGVHALRQRRAGGVAQRARRRVPGVVAGGRRRRRRRPGRRRRRGSA